MEQLVTRIKEEGHVHENNVLDVSAFFNGRIDADLMDALGKDFAEAFKHVDFDAFVTVESSGIAPSLCASIHARKPLIIIKKDLHEKNTAEICQTPCFSYTKQHTFHLSVHKHHLDGKRVILIDDFLAQGNVLNSLETLLADCNAKLVGLGICIAKTFQSGYKRALNGEIPFHCQAKILSLNPLIVES